MSRILVGMSGGVDSSVTALLLKKQGYDVVGVTMKLLDNAENMTHDAKIICEKLGIEYHVVDFSKAFKEKVIDYFSNEYINGRTPNPCNMCNRYLKFGLLLDSAINNFNCENIATGHYAKVDYSSDTGRYFLRKSDTDKKDQTYALYKLTQEQLSRVIMPLGSYEKENVRKIAEENGLINAKKKDSQEICFVPDNNYIKFIEDNYNFKSKKGNFVDLNGNILGEHKGIIHYTIGQRKGLEIAFQKRMYVIDIDPVKNEVVLGNDEDLFIDNFICDDINFMAIDGLKKPIPANVKIRYSAKPEKAELIPLNDGSIKVVFSEKQRAITPGQSAVFYKDDIVLGGGTIKQMKS